MFNALESLRVNFLLIKYNHQPVFDFNPFDSHTISLDWRDHCIEDIRENGWMFE